jgi:tetratricopeptide (TPR) repeat protein
MRLPLCFLLTCFLWPALAAQEDETWTQDLRLAIEELDKGRLARARLKLDEILGAAEDPPGERPPAEVLRSARSASWRISELEGSYTELLAELGEAAAGDRDDPEVQRLEARVLTAVGRYEDASTLVARRLEADPDDHEARWQRGSLLSLLGRRDDARKEFAESVARVAQRMPERPAQLAAAARSRIAQGRPPASWRSRRSAARRSSRTGCWSTAS